MTSVHKYPIRSYTRKAEKPVDKLRLLFNAVNDFVKENHTDEEKTAVMEELKMWQDGEESIQKDMAEMLTKHLEPAKAKETTEESIRPKEKDSLLPTVSRRGNTMKAPASSAMPDPRVCATSQAMTSKRLVLPSRRVSRSSVGVAREIMRRLSICPTIPEDIVTIE